MKKLLPCLLATLVTTAFAAETPTAGKAVAEKPAAVQKGAPGDARAVIAKKFPGVTPDDVRPSPMKGVYEVVMGADIAYVSADGRYLIAGDMYEVGSRTNLTEAKRNQERVQTLAKLDEREMIVFKPAVVKHTITVFTDVDCGYCRKLHAEIGELNEMGVKVRYLAYPRAGPGTEDWRKMEAVWCANDRKGAITEAKAGRDVKSQQCATPVAKQFQLGEDLGVRGTPAIFTTGGDYIGGYLPPGQMLKELERLSAAAKN